MRQHEQEEVAEIMLSEPQTDIISARTAMILDMAGQGAGKTENIAVATGWMVTEFPMVRGFIAANTYLQLNQSTLNKVFKGWERYYALTEYDPKTNPGGHYVVDKEPPPHFVRYERLKNYYNTISFRNGALIYVGSLDNYKAHDGKEFGWAHLDETKDTKKEALSTVILARLRQYGLWVTEDGDVVWDDGLGLEEAREQAYKSWNPCYIHTSPAEGGVDWLIDMFKLGKDEELIHKTLLDPYDYYRKETEYQTVVIYQTFWNEENLPPGYIAAQRDRMSESEQLKFIHGYPFSKTGGEFFPHFSRRYHVTKLEADTSKVFHLSYDFNVMPYLTQIVAQVEYVTSWWSEEHKNKTSFPEQGRTPIEVMRIKVIKEYAMKDPLNTTEAAAQAFINDFGATPIDVFVYGDASGRNRITGLGSKTQYWFIEQMLYKYLPNGWLRAPKANVGRLKRRDFINRILEGKLPAVELYIDEDCEELIRDMEYVKLGTDGKFKETAKDPNTGVRYEKIGHMSDALEYMVCELCKHYLNI